MAKRMQIRGQNTFNRISRAGGSGLMLPTRKHADFGPVNVVLMATAFQQFINPTPMTGNQYTYSLWFQSDVADADEYRVWAAAVTNANSSNRTNGSRTLTTELLQSQQQNVAGDVVTRVRSLISVLQETHHMACSVSGTTGVVQLFIDGVDQTNPTVDNSPDTIDWRDRYYLWSRPVDFTIPFLGRVAEFWMADEFNNLPTDIGKFVSPQVTPVDLGPRGELVNGNIPEIYMGGDMTADTGGFLAGPGGANSGWNGGCNNGSATFTGVTGTVTDSSA